MGCAASSPAAPPGPALPGLEAPAATREPGPPGPPRVKLVLLGDSGVGKSCLALRLARNEFDPASAVTVGAAFLSTTLTVPAPGGAGGGPGGVPVRLDIWDTAGQERYASLAPLYYRGARAAAVVYAVDDAASFGRAGHWVRELAANAGRGRAGGGGGEEDAGAPAASHQAAAAAAARPMVVALIGNKADLGATRVVSAAEGAAAAAAAGLLFAETSAAEDGGSVGAAFLRIAGAVAEAEGWV